MEEKISAFLVKNGFVKAIWTTRNLVCITPDTYPWMCHEYAAGSNTRKEWHQIEDELWKNRMQRLEIERK